MDRVHELTAYLAGKGLFRKDRGTLYLAHALWLLETGDVETRRLHVWRLYEKVAQAYETTPQAVEWDIRFSLKKLYSVTKEHATNKEFILRTYDELIFGPAE